MPGTARLAGWLGRTIVTLVRTYTSPGDRVLLLIPPTPEHAPPGTHSTDPYAGLSEAVWTVTRLGRSVDTATETSSPDHACDHTDPPADIDAESGSGHRPSRLGLRAVADPDADSAHPPRPTDSNARDRFDLIITALHPHATDWFSHTDWAAMLTPHGLSAVVTYSDHYRERLLDPHSVLTKTLSNQGLRRLDHIAVLAAGLPDRLGGSAAPRPYDLDPLHVRSVHHDLVLFGRLPAPNDRKGTADV
ncbi:hypothetical protein FPZ12_020365 [Amycolatopsis acidicola]|uniref:Uncharacterized protein n=1 Tax=Amycolatopsis acidicola TaxID=2596893 RepID=A0A5N0V1H1_9PSEU|nr:hypothetical protein [Amycolatopsis acidicola]KAA9159455.1 hypothetical protein FPZ12_020365 [Amycolatopsis acidicola]